MAVFEINFGTLATGLAVVVTVTVTTLPLTTEPRLQVTGPDPEQEPCGTGAADTKVTAEGINSFSETLAASEGPLFLTTTLYVSV